MMWGTMAALLIAVGIGALAVRRLTEPLVKLRKVAMGMGQEREIKGDEFRKQKKDLQEELKTMQSSDEIGNLAKAFSQMYDRLDQAFMSLQGSLRDWERTFDSVADPIFILDRNNRILRLNHAAAHLLKKKPQEVLGETCYRLIHGTEAPPDFCPHEITLKTGKPAKAEVEEPYLGGIFEIATTPIVDEAGQVIGSVHVTRDITERKRAEIKLQESEERYRILAETAHDMIFIIDRKGYVQYVNHFAASQFRTLPEQIIGKLQEELFPHEIAKRQKANLQKVFETGKPFYGENKIQFPNGEVWLGTWLNPIAKESEDVGAVLGISRDITERKRMEEALQLSEEKYRSVVANANDAIFIAQDGMIKFPNPSALDITGISAEEYATTPFINLIHPEDREMVIERHKQRLNGEEVQNNYSFRILNKAGEELWVQLNAVLIKWEERPAVLCFMRDITPQRRLEAQFQQAQKMEAVGTLAGGIAHDFNNLLQTVLGYAEILLHEEVGKSISQELQQIKRAAQRGAELTQQILTFGRKVQSKLRPVDLNIEVRQVQKLLQRTIPKMIHVELRLTDDLGVINADPAQMEQILMNLSVNAKDAMPEGGKLIIGTKNIFLDESYCSGNLEAHPGEHVLLTVSDTGHGMKKETLEHIFEPFYTTKGVGKGTGLGLAMVYGIVKSHGGHIQCFSQPGKGTTFSVYFPVIEDRITIEGPVEEKILVGGKETILLVDDEKPIQELGERILLRSGYTVLKASDGESALEIYRRGDERIDLVILDLIMPGMGGKKCLEKILEINPKAKVVIASGYSPDVTSDNPIETGAKAFVPKPFNINQMLQVVRKVLDE